MFKSFINNVKSIDEIDCVSIWYLCIKSRQTKSGSQIENIIEDRIIFEAEKAYLGKLSMDRDRALALFLLSNGLKTAEKQREILRDQLEQIDWKSDLFRRAYVQKLREIDDHKRQIAYLQGHPN